MTTGIPSGGRRTGSPDSGPPVVLDGESLTLEELWQAACLGRRVSLHGEIRERVERARQVVEEALRDGRVVYGVTTGFGKFKDQVISPDEVRTLQRNLLLSHACGVGERFPDEVVRAMVVLRANGLARGHSGVRYAIIERLVELLNRRVHPVVPSRGSVGASGDLAPLAHLALPLIGEGEVVWNGQVSPAGEVLREIGLSPLVLEAKEGLALVNGTQAMAACAARALVKGQRLLAAADIAGAMSLEALMGSAVPFEESLQRLRPHPGQAVTANNIRRMLAGSPLMASHKECGQVQDAYAIRCIPQVHGAVKDALSDVSRVVRTELNSVTDNPLIFPGADGSSIFSGGNFHGHPISLYCDFFRAAITSLANMAERRTDRLLNPVASSLPPFLVKQGGVNSGLMIPQYVQASLVAECKILSSPCAVDSIPTSAYQEDFVTMGTTSARLALQVVEHAEYVVGIELMVAAQALEFRRPHTFGPGTEAALAAIRTRVPPLDHDRMLKPDIEQTTALLRDGTLQAAVEGSIGSLETGEGVPGRVP